MTTEPIAPPETPSYELGVMVFREMYDTNAFDEIKAPPPKPLRHWDLHDVLAGFPPEVAGHLAAVMTTHQLAYLGDYFGGPDDPYAEDESAAQDDDS